MAELASGAVSSLLGVRLLGRVRGDVQFIREEMESMNSFLLHLARTAPPGREHDEQVGTWMNQVRQLAQDCNNCINLYLYRGNPDIQRARGGLWGRYLWWVPWSLEKMAAQQHAAAQLRALKDRARDVGDRRLRYGVEVPAGKNDDDGKEKEVPAAVEVPAAAAAGGRDHDDGGDDQPAAASRTSSLPRAELLKPRTPEDFLKWKLREWIDEMYMKSFLAIVAPSSQGEEACALACEVLDHEGYHVLVVDLPAVHLEFLPLRPKDILFYIMREVELHHLRARDRGSISSPSPQSRDDLQDVSEWQAGRMRKWGAYAEKKKVLREIMGCIQEMKVYHKLEEVKEEVQQVKADQLRLDLQKIKYDDEAGCGSYFSDKSLGALLLLLLKSAAVVAQQDRRKLAACYKDFIEATAKKLQERLEGGSKQAPPPISLHTKQYEDILREVFPKTSDTKDQQEQDTEQVTRISITTTLDENQIQGIVDKVRHQILREVLPMTGGDSKPQQQDSMQQIKGEPRHDERVTELKSDTKQTASKLDDSMVEETKERIETIKWKIKMHLKIKGIMDRIEQLMRGRITRSSMVILKIDNNTLSLLMDTSVWEDTRSALSLLPCVGGALIITTSKQGTQRAKEYCFPPWEPIDYSVVGIYHATVLALASQKMQQDAQIFRDIVDVCAPHEFCMKIFAHALYAKPKRSNEELHQLLGTLKEVSPKTFVGIAKKMIKFSYNDLPQEYKSCLLYLSIFPQGHNIRRSTLIGRWVVEGLITKEDWFTSVCQAERCFDALIHRWLVYPGDIGATGKVKSCVVGAEIHGFITKIARKQHIVEARLSHHLARHFSIFNDVRLRGSDKIDKFFQKLPKSHQLSLIKVLDLEECHCFGEKNQSYLKDICSNILLLKYLSLKRTDVTQLPREINHLHELEVLDIRQTKVPAFATKSILLLKLKRLLAGHTVPSPSNTDTGMAAQVPDKIGKMLNMEVLSDVRPRSGRDLEDIGSLCQLKKLGLVIDKNDHLINLVGAISDLHESLQSLSITLPITSCDGTLSSTEFPDDIQSRLTYRPKLLESLSICGTTAKGSLLSMFAKYGDSLVKVTLSRASLNQEELNILAKLPMLSCVRLQHIVCTQRNVTFKENKFQKLKYFLVEGSNITDIDFQHRAVLELEKIVLSFTTNMESLHGIENLPRLKELEFNGDPVPTEVEEVINKLKSRYGFNFKHNKPEQAKGDAAKEDGDAARFPFCW